MWLFQKKKKKKKLFTSLSNVKDATNAQRTGGGVVTGGNTGTQRNADTQGGDSAQASPNIELNPLNTRPSKLVPTQSGSTGKDLPLEPRADTRPSRLTAEGL